MYFRDEFEYSTINNQTFYVEVDGFIVNDDGFIINEIKTLNISDGNENITEDHDSYEEIYDYTLNREYNHEEEGRDFTYFDGAEDKFLGEREDDIKW